MKKKKKNAAKLPPDFAGREKKAMVRDHRQVFFLNEKESAAVDEYCRRFGVSSHSALFRQAVMEHVLKGLDEVHPTLF